jgi:hypothetical protein
MLISKKISCSSSPQKISYYKVRKDDEEVPPMTGIENAKIGYYPAYLPSCGLQFRKGFRNK